MFFLSETLTKDTSVHSTQYLKSLGVDLPTHNATNVAKKTAHEKYY